MIAGQHYDEILITFGGLCFRENFEFWGKQHRNHRE